ncbi:MAG: hypothetical protein J3R72DRAFT_445242, partial [Linnemannia gamsii]
MYPVLVVVLSSTSWIIILAHTCLVFFVPSFLSLFNACLLWSPFVPLCSLSWQSVSHCKCVCVCVCLTTHTVN